MFVLVELQPGLPFRPEMITCPLLRLLACAPNKVKSTEKEGRLLFVSSAHAYERLCRSFMQNLNDTGTSQVTPSLVALSFSLSHLVCFTDECRHCLDANAGLSAANSCPAKTTSTQLQMSVVPAVVKKQSVGDLDEVNLKGKKVLVRCDLNVPLDGKTIGDDTRIRASIPTIEYLLEKGARVALSSHLGRPKDGPEDKFSLAPVAERLTELLGKDCKMAPDCIGDEVASIADGLKDGEVMLLENVRFYPAETKNEPGELMT